MRSSIVSNCPFILAMSSSMRPMASPSCCDCCRSRACSSEMKDAWFRMIAVCSLSCFCRATKSRVCSSISRCMFCASNSGFCCARPSSSSLLIMIIGGWSRFRCAHSPTVDVSVMLGRTLMESRSPSLRSVSTTFLSTCCVAAEMASFTEDSGGRENFQLRPWCMNTARHSTDLARASAGELDLMGDRFTTWAPMVMEASPPFNAPALVAVGAGAVEVYVETRGSPLEQCVQYSLDEPSVLRLRLLMVASALTVLARPLLDILGV
mmetsp:Transcript_86384/g.252797  ORF Transcript_86384/g.252797 Transcript_86384/m.252797 type:complete len:265 (+) Transcript_86384:110-904(+)